MVRFKACVTFYQKGKRARRRCMRLSEKKIARLMKLPKGSKINNFLVDVPQL